MNEIQIKKQRTEGTAKMIIDIMKHLDLTSLVSSIFVQTDDKFGKELIKRYELKLIEAFEEPDKFEQSLHSFYQEMARYIKKNHLYKEFNSFCYFIYSSLDVKKMDKNFTRISEGALNSYFNILFQQVNYFVPHPKIAYGLDSKGNLLTTNEPFPYLDVVLMEAFADEKKQPSMQEIYKKYKKLGYDISSEYDFARYQANDHLITNMIITMSCFINEKTLDIFTNNYYMIAEGINLEKPKTDTKVFKDALLEKSYFLPINGVKVKYTNFAEIKEIFFQEVFTDNRIVLLYKCTATNGKEFNGFYDNKLGLFYSPWDATDNGAIYHKYIENIILEAYAYLTTDIDLSNDLNKRIYLNESVPVFVKNTLPTVEFIYQEKEKEKQDRRDKKSSIVFKNFDKRNYKPAKVTINPFTRRLPVGANASDEAIALAKEFHYVLREGETFVKPFERKTYRKND